MTQKLIEKARKITVLGAGSWGTALAQHIAVGGFDVAIWDCDKAVLESISQQGINTKYFPTFSLNQRIRPEVDILNAVEGASLVVLAVPSDACRGVCERAQEGITDKTLIASMAKGLETKTLKRMTEVIADILGNSERITAVSGPSFAAEVLKGLPTAVTAASTCQETTQQIANVFHHSSFRVYSSNDPIGVEIGGAVKNVIALAAGIGDGAGMGTNARAALMTRGLAELQRLVVSMGGNPLTVAGLSGLGDLLLTATGDLSRNRRVGMLLGQGQPLKTALEIVGQVAEGVVTAPKALELAQKQQIEMPIVAQVNRVLTGECGVHDALKNLLSRAPTQEFCKAG